jgi:hypothetical protein
MMYPLSNLVISTRQMPGEGRVPLTSCPKSVYGNAVCDGRRLSEVKIMTRNDYKKKVAMMRSMTWLAGMCELLQTPDASVCYGGDR